MPVKSHDVTMRRTVNLCQGTNLQTLLRMEDLFMKKKVLSLVLASAMVVSLAGCGN